MNTGYKGKKYDIYAYNGGLFAPDEILDNISIDDEILHKHTLTLSQYDFETDVDVNILGHIFEHTLGEIENVQAEIKGEKIESQKTKWEFNVASSDQIPLVLPGHFWKHATSKLTVMLPYYTRSTLFSSVTWPLPVISNNNSSDYLYLI